MSSFLDVETNLRRCFRSPAVNFWRTRRSLRSAALTCWTERINSESKYIFLVVRKYRCYCHSLCFKRTADRFSWPVCQGRNRQIHKRAFVSDVLKRVKEEVAKIPASSKSGRQVAKKITKGESRAGGNCQPRFNCAHKLCHPRLFSTPAPLGGRWQVGPTPVRHKMLTSLPRHVQLCLQ